MIARFVPLTLLLMTGCGMLPFGQSDTPEAPPPIILDPEEQARVAPSAAPTRTAAALDTVSDAEKAAARATAAAATSDGVLGEVTVALGDPSDAGLWVKSGLVSAATQGTVRTGSGDAIAVQLRPLGSDGGPQISLGALRALGLPLTGLHSVTLTAAG